MQPGLGKAAFQAVSSRSPGMELRAPRAQGSSSRCSPIPGAGSGSRPPPPLPPAAPARAAGSGADWLSPTRPAFLLADPRLAAPLRGGGAEGGAGGESGTSRGCGKRRERGLVGWIAPPALISSCAGHRSSRVLRFPFGQIWVGREVRKLQVAEVRR